MAKSSGKRFMKLAGMTASIAGKAAKNSLRHLSSDEEKRLQARSELMQDVGIQIAETLGEMKGAVMKVGQIASQYKDVFPPEVATALEKLQKDAPPMPYAQIRAQIERELKAPVDQLFTMFEETPFAAASIGQVHRAILPSGQKVVVKVQYPDVDENCDSDLKQVRMALKIAGVLNMSKQLQEQLFNEIRQSLHDELDYVKEAHNLQVFGAFHTDDQGLIIPKVINSHSTRRVLTLTEEIGETLTVAATWNNEIKQKIAKRLFHFTAGQLFGLYRMHCDPHPGNFAFRHDGSVVAYDFGGIRSYSHSEVQLFRRFAQHAVKGDVTALEQDLIALDIRREDDKNVPGEFYEKWLAIGMKPLSIAPYQEGAFDFGSSQVHHEAISQMRTSLKYFGQFQPSATTMMLDRTVSGQYWNLVNLGVEIDLSPLVAEYITN
ncbi:MULTISPECIES: ABC1 kinase family protein [Psychrobacter]|jgi:predicted unusual protein kinase regulating ubiquinone biosynthesis (AarF/ABC1/UbiB family)|uniref:ABC1 kinase family protein n=1 Tax=Psychrobacter TaxID=497 RepID=UPI000406A257|nr:MULTISPECIES: AarF/ABC1/UbiB kinase family protein [Psychrobacter]PKG34073.1 ABC transporter [Psychrobacter sp. Sarcosine-3u-12]